MKTSESLKSNKSINNLLNAYPIEFSMRLNKLTFSKNEKVIGFLKLAFKKNYSISDINMKFYQIFQFIGWKKTEFFENNLISQQIQIKDYVTFDNNSNEIQPGLVIMPFNFKIPSNSQPTIIYSNKNYKCSVLSFLSFEYLDKIENKVYSFKHEINVVNNDNNIPIDLISNEQNVSFQKDNNLTNKDFSLEVTSDSNKYSYGDIIKLNIKVINRKKDYKVSKIKLSLYLRIKWNKFEDKNESTEVEKKKINTKNINCNQFSNDKLDINETLEIAYNHNSFFDCLTTSHSNYSLNQNLRLSNENNNEQGYIILSKEEVNNTIKEKKFDKGRPKMKIPPSVNSKVLNIEYYIKATTYFQHFVGHNSRPRAFLYFRMIN